MTPQQWLLVDQRLAAHAAALGRHYSPDVSKLYRNHLAPLDFDLVSDALTLSERDQTFVPQVAEILNCCVDLTLRRASGIDRAFPAPEEAWREVVNRAGRRGQPSLCHPAAWAAAQQMGGLDAIWHDLQWSGAPEGMTRSRFLEAFRAEVERRRAAVKSALYRPTQDPDLFPRWNAPALTQQQWPGPAPLRIEAAPMRRIGGDK